MRPRVKFFMTDSTLQLRDLVVSAVTEIKHDRLASAQALLDQVIVAAPHEPVPLYLSGTVQYRLGNFEGAESLFRQSLRISPGQPDACFHLAQSLSALKRPNEAIDFCRQALKSRPDFPDAWLEMATAQAEIGAIREAETGYRRVLAMTFNLTAILNLTALLNSQDEFGESEQILRHALSWIFNV